MIKIACANYGFECEFQVCGDKSKVIEEYQKHSNDEHGIEQSTEALEQIILRMKR